MTPPPTPTPLSLPLPPPPATPESFGNQARIGIGTLFNLAILFVVVEVVVVVVVMVGVVVVIAVVVVALFVGLRCCTAGTGKPTDITSAPNQSRFTGSWIDFVTVLAHFSPHAKKKKGSMYAIRQFGKGGVMLFLSDCRYTPSCHRRRGMTVVLVACANPNRLSTHLRHYVRTNDFRPMWGRPYG